MSSVEEKTRHEIESEIIAKAWKDDEFKQDLLNNPKGVLSQELGMPIPEDIEVKVLEENPNTVYLVLPEKPADLEAEGELSDEALEAVAGGGGGFIAYSHRTGRTRWIAGGC